jgi:hypothetical protein
MRIVKVSDEQTRLRDNEARNLAEMLVDGVSIQERFVPEPRLKTTGVGYMKNKGADEFARKSPEDLTGPKAWLQSASWATVETINQHLCLTGHGQSGRTSDGYEPAKQLWEQSMPTTMPLEQALDVCFKCHKLAPFLNFNGNTFAAIARAIIRDILVRIGQPQSQVLESVVGHYVAGTEGREALTKVLAEIRTK